MQLALFELEQHPQTKLKLKAIKRSIKHVQEDITNTNNYEIATGHTKKVCMPSRTKEAEELVTD